MAVTTNTLELNTMPSNTTKTEAETLFELGLKYQEGKDVPLDYKKAAECFQQAANLGHVHSYFKLTNLFCDGNGVPQDYKKAAELLQIGIDLYQKSQVHNQAQSNQLESNQLLSKAQCNLAILYRKGLGVPQDFKKALELYQQAANLGFKEAFFGLALLYGTDEGLGKDSIKTAEFLQKAAALGHIEAQYILGCHYEEGVGVTQDYKKAVELFQQAADQGKVEAQFRLAELFKIGRGVQKDFNKAAFYYQQAANQGHTIAQFSIGLFYYQGLGVPQDFKKGIEFLTLAAKNNHGEAQFLLGAIYYQGTYDIPQDYQRAFEFLDQSIKNGNNAGKVILANMYELGNGIPQDFKKAFELYQQAINECEDNTAFYRMGVMYLVGTGVEKDLKKAYELFKKSAEKGHLSAPLHFTSFSSTESKENAETIITTIKTYKVLIEEPRRIYIKNLLRNRRLQTIIDHNFICNFPDIYGISDALNSNDSDLRANSIGLHHREPGSLNNITIHDLMLFFQYCTFLSTLPDNVLASNESRMLSLNDDLTPVHAKARSIMLTHAEYVNIFEIPFERHPEKRQAIIDFMQLFRENEIYSVKKIGVAMNSNDVLLPLLPIVSHLEINLDLLDVADPEPLELTQQKVQSLRTKLLTTLSSLRGQKTLKTITLNLAKWFDSSNSESSANYTKLGNYLGKYPIFKELFSKGLLTELGKSISESSIEGLKISWCFLGMFPVGEILGFFNALEKSKLVYLDLSNNKLGLLKQDFLKIAAAISKLHIKYLNLSDNSLEQCLGLDEKANQSFLFQLGKSLKNIAKLDLSYNFFAQALYSTDVPATGVKAIDSRDGFSHFGLGFSGGTINTLLLNGVFNIIPTLRSGVGANVSEALFKTICEYQNSPNYESFRKDIFEFFITLFERLRLNELGLDETHLCHLLKINDWNYLVLLFSQSDLNVLYFNRNFGLQDKAMVETFCNIFKINKCTLSFLDPLRSFNENEHERYQENMHAMEMLSNFDDDLSLTSNPENLIKSFETRIQNIQSILLSLGMDSDCISLVTEYSGKTNATNIKKDVHLNTDLDETPTSSNVHALMCKYYGLKQGATDLAQEQTGRAQPNSAQAGSAQAVSAQAESDAASFKPLYKIVDVQVKEEISNKPSSKGPHSNMKKQYRARI